MSRSRLDEAFTALRRDLVHPDGPRISTMRRLFNYALLQYVPAEELRLREQVQRLVTDLAGGGWMVHTVSLYSLLLRHLDALGDETVQQICEMERRLTAIRPDRGMNHLRTKLSDYLTEPTGIAADVSADIDGFLAAHPEQLDRTVVLVGRAGTLYPFFRLSALLKHLDDRARAVPVILLYPGTRKSGNQLSFMGKLESEGDYRPRIYP